MIIAVKVENIFKVHLQKPFQFSENPPCAIIKVEEFPLEADYLGGSMYEDID